MQRYPYRQQPQMVDTGDVPYVSYISEQAEPLMMQAAANAQQRYDLAQTAIAKYLEENAAAKFRDADYNTAMAKLNQDLENIKTTVKDRYDGQYWQAYPEIVKGLSKARQTYHLAQKAYEEEQKYAPMYAKLQAEGKLLFPEGDPRTRSVFNQEGQYVGGVDFSKFRERSDYDKIIEDAVVRGIDKTAVESGLINSKTAGYLLQLQRSGLAALGNTEQEIDNKIDKIAEEYAPIFEAQTTYGIDPDRPKISSKEYVKDAIYRLASSKTGRQYTVDRNYDPNGGKGNDDFTPDGSVVYEGGLVANPKGFTFRTFFKNSPNARHIISSQANEPLKEVNPSSEDYSKGIITLEQLQAFTIEKRLRDSNEQLNDLFIKGSKSDDDIAKQFGYSSMEDFKKKSRDKDISTIDSRVSEAIAERSRYAKLYSDMLKQEAANFIDKFGMDLDYNIMFYQPDFSQEKVSTQYNNWNANIKNDFTMPGQFTYLDGDLRNKSSDEINETYKKKKADFGVMGVGGNDATGLIWKVKNPDGTISNAKWNTGYKKQAGYIKNILRNPELINVLNSSALDITNGEIKGTYPDIAQNIDTKVKKYKLSAEPDAQDPNLYYIRSGNGYIQIQFEDGNKYISTVSSASEATLVPKNLMFDIINSLN